MNKNRIKNWGTTSILILAIVGFLYTTQIKANYIYSYVRHKQIENNDEINLLCDAYGVTLSDNIIGVEYIATMTDEHKELFEKYTDCVREYHTITDCLLFQNSFKLGARMMLAVMEE